MADGGFASSAYRRGQRNAGAALGTAMTQTYSTTATTVPNATTAAVTDSTGGSVGTTLAVGAGVSILQFQHTFIGGTSEVEPVTNLVLGYKFKIISWAAVTSVLLVGAGGSRVANMEIGTTDVGTVPSTCTIVVANAALGTVTTGTAVSGANTGTASDNFSIEIANGGTAFTAGSVTFCIVVQNMDTADAIASVNDQLTKEKADSLILKQLINKLIDADQAVGMLT